jgi:murein DD-endopeptidase MepM/ murein hydrolase activator NlpD
LKRAHLRRVRSVPCSLSQVETAVEHEQIVAPGVKRKKRTSAAMIGLALSMGASSLLIPRQNEGATAAEPTPTDAATIAAATIAAVPAASTAPTAQMAEHVVTKGQTLWQLSRQYKVDVGAIAAANALKIGDVIKVGQVIHIPTAGSSNFAAAEASPAVSTPQLVASADLNHLPVKADVPASPQADAVKAERNASLDRLRQQQEKLRQSLAALRTQETAVKDTVKPGSSTIAAKPPQPESQPSGLVAASPASDPDWLHSNQALGSSPATPALIAEIPRNVTPAPAARVAQHQPTVVPPVQQIAANPNRELVAYQVSPGDTAALIARAHNVSLSALVQANRISDPNFIFVGQVLRVPAAPVARAEQSQPTQPVAARPSVVPTSVVPTTVSLAPQPLAVGGSLPTEASTSGLDPHVESLLADIKVLRERHRATTTAAVPTAPAPQVVAATPSSSLPSLSVSTQFNPGGLNAVQTQGRSQSQTIRVPAADRPQAIAPRQSVQVAAAPAGSESYAPLVQPVTGRMVSPDLPPLQGEDNFLPEGAPAFNGYLWPAKGELTSGYGWRWGRMHAGIDIAADIGTPIFAAADGVVEYSDWNSGGYGNLVEVRHADGSMTRYGHLNQSLVQVGQKVKQGEQIAEMGSTGYSTGPHLHFEVHPAGGDGGAVDPIAYLPQK